MIWFLSSFLLTAAPIGKVIGVENTTHTHTKAKRAWLTVNAQPHSIKGVVSMTDC